MRAASIVIGLLWVALADPATAQAANSLRALDCQALMGVRLSHAVSIVAERVEVGRFKAPDGTRYEVPSFCHIHVEARPIRESQIEFELWMPEEHWNGRYYQLGNGGFAGSIHYPSLAAELHAGNAVAATDTGHHSDGFDATWALGHAERIVDYGYRSLKETSDAANALIRAYYGRPPGHRYFAGCSNGGRQALMVAQRFPRDWDGIVAGAPAYYWTRQLAVFAWLQQQLLSSDSWIEPAKLPAIQLAAINSCTPAARIIAGIPTDPRFCHFDPADLLCKDRETSECLTRNQVRSLSMIQAGPLDPQTGHPLFFGFESTAAADESGWKHWILNSQIGADSQRKFGEQFFRNFVFDDPRWNSEDFETSDFLVAQNRLVADEPLHHVLDATSIDLTRFEAGGAKLLMYFGWNDAVISPRAALDYYERVSARMGGIEKTRAFFRLFPVPGMGHCQGGPGANAFGQSLTAPALSDDRDHNVRRSLEAWVEHGIAPETLIAAKYVDDDPTQGVANTRLLCAFPDVSEYRSKSNVGSSDAHRMCSRPEASE